MEHLARDYRVAPGGEGPLAAEWKDKPHRLIYDLCSEVDRLEAELIGEREQGNLDFERLKAAHAEEIRQIQEAHGESIQQLHWDYSVGDWSE